MRTIFPYVLGALTPEMLVARWELDAITKLLRRKERELATIRQVSVRWQMEVQSWLDRARELGLLPSDHRPPADWAVAIDTLRAVGNMSFREAIPSGAGIQSALAEALKLSDQERHASAELFEQRQRLKELEKLRESATSYGGALAVQRERLALSTWLRALAEPSPSDPLSGPALAPSADLDRLCRALGRIEAEASAQPVATETIDNELLRVRAAVAQLAERLTAVRDSIKALEATAPASAPAFSIPDVERFIGRLQQAISTYESVGTDSDLAEEIGRLRDRAQALAETFSEARINAAMQRALTSIQTIAATILPKLDAEWPDKPIRLSVQDLSIRVLSSNREDSLWEIGSGANWLAYHVAVTAALQRYFMQDRAHPVPHLLVYDQPSQVYFPRRAAGDTEDDTEPTWRDEDITAVRKVFSALSDEVKASKGRLQITILDHADEEVWGGLDEVHIVAEWRSGLKLVPEQWLREDPQ